MWLNDILAPSAPLSLDRSMTWTGQAFWAKSIESRLQLDTYLHLSYDHTQRSEDTPPLYIIRPPPTCSVDLLSVTTAALPSPPVKRRRHTTQQRPTQHPSDHLHPSPQPSLNKVGFTLRWREGTDAIENERGWISGKR